MKAQIEADKTVLESVGAMGGDDCCDPCCNPCYEVESMPTNFRLYDSGAVRDSRNGKGRFDLLPKATLWALARHFEKGANHYEDRNWELGQKVSDYLDSADRHLAEFELFKNAKEDHLISAIWNLVACYETLLRIKNGVLPAELDDYPHIYEDENAELKV